MSQPGRFGPDIPCLAICPGYVSTDLTPAFFKLGTPILTICRAFTPGFNITSERGANALLAVATAEPGSLRSDKKYVTAGERLVPAEGGFYNLEKEEVERAWQLCSSWLQLWRQHAAAEAQKQAAARSTQDSPAKRG